MSAADFLRQMYEILKEKYPNLIVNIYPITNFFFGESITVTGLLTGRDIAVQLERKDLGSEVFISDVMLRGQDGKFLDDMKVEDVAGWINKKITPIGGTGGDFARALIGMTEN